MNPPTPPDEPRGQIQLRLSMARKNAYVRAARPGKLTAWIFRVLDRAAGFEPSVSSEKADGAKADTGDPRIPSPHRSQTLGNQGNSP